MSATHAESRCARPRATCRTDLPSTPAPGLLQEELAQLKPGERIERVAPPPPPQMSSQRSYGQQAVGKLLGSPLEASSALSGGPSSGMGAGASQPRQEELSGMWEVLTLDEEGRPFLDRCAGGRASNGRAGRACRAALRCAMRRLELLKQGLVVLCLAACRRALPARVACSTVPRLHPVAARCCLPGWRAGHLLGLAAHPVHPMPLLPAGATCGAARTSRSGLCGGPCSAVNPRGAGAPAIGLH